MKHYQISLTLTGAMTQLPDSQRLFGSLVSMFALAEGDEKATTLTKEILEKKVHFALSNVMPSGYLPMPQEYLIDCISENSGETEASTAATLKQQRADIKERCYIRREEINEIVKKRDGFDLLYPYVTLRNTQQSRASIESLRYDIPGLDSKLFSVPTVILSEVTMQNGVHRNQVIASYCFYLQVEEKGIASIFFSWLQKAVEEHQLIQLGKRASQGLNTFRLGDISVLDVALKSTKTYVNLGMLLPDQICFSSSTIKLFTSERRPFDLPGGWNEAFTKHYLTFIAEGSIIKIQGEVQRAGKCIPSPFSQRDIVFGNAFLYPIQLPSKEV